MSAEEIAENERLWREENDETLDRSTADAAAEMRGVGISSSAIGSDLDSLDAEVPGDEPGVDGGEAPPPDTSTGNSLGNAGAPAAGQPNDVTI
jgi:hypothetical protein